MVIKLKTARTLAKQWLKNNNNDVIFRSCWKCNSAHEHLKKADYVFNCMMGCGHWYFRGVDITCDEED